MRREFKSCNLFSGEWYYTTHFGPPEDRVFEDPNIDGLTPRQWNDRRDILNALLSNIPTSMSVKLSIVSVRPCCSLYEGAKLILVLLRHPSCYTLPLLPIGSLLSPLVVRLCLSNIPRYAVLPSQFRSFLFLRPGCFTTSASLGSRPSSVRSKFLVHIIRILIILPVRLNYSPISSLRSFIFLLSPVFAPVVLWIQYCVSSTTCVQLRL